MSFGVESKLWIVFDSTPKLNKWYCLENSLKCGIFNPINELFNTVTLKSTDLAIWMDLLSMHNFVTSFIIKYYSTELGRSPECWHFIMYHQIFKKIIFTTITTKLIRKSLSTWGLSSSPYLRIFQNSNFHVKFQFLFLATNTASSSPQSKRPILFTWENICQMIMSG